LARGRKRRVLWRESFAVPVTGMHQQRKVRTRNTEGEKGGHVRKPLNDRRKFTEKIEKDTVGEPIATRKGGRPEGKELCYFLGGGGGNRLTTGTAKEEPRAKKAKKGDLREWTGTSLRGEKERTDSKATPYLEKKPRGHKMVQEITENNEEKRE